MEPRRPTKGGGSLIHDLNPYPEYKDSGIQWLGDVPEHWEVKRNKLFMREINERSADGSEELLTVSQYTGVTARREKLLVENGLLSNAASLIGYKRVIPGDLVMNIMLAWNGSLGVSPIAGIASPAYCVYRATTNIEPRFFHYLFRTPLFTGVFKTASTGVIDSRLRLYPEVFFRLPSLIPPKAEQSVIVLYLDHIDRRIRRYIRAKQKLIKLLEEQKQAIIHQAVTRGLDPNVRLKSSGVEWLGDVPEHWNVFRVKQISKILRGKFTHRPRNDPALYEGQYPFIQTGEVARAGKLITSFKQTLNDRGFAVSKMFPRGTLVMTIAANIGDVAVLDFEACFPDSIVGFVPQSFVERDFLYYVFNAMKPELLREAPVNTQGNLNVDRIGFRVIGLPPLEEQKEIVFRVEERIKDFDKVIAVAQDEISLLREYRTHLIADVVTGKLDVREAAANLPEEDEKEVLEEELAKDEDTKEEDIDSEIEEE